MRHNLAMFLLLREGCRVELENGSWLAGHGKNKINYGFYHEHYCESEPMSLAGMRAARKAIDLYHRENPPDIVFVLRRDGMTKEDVRALNSGEIIRKHYRIDRKDVNVTWKKETYCFRRMYHVDGGLVKNDIYDIKTGREIPF